MYVLYKHTHHNTHTAHTARTQHTHAHSATHMQPHFVTVSLCCRLKEHTDLHAIDNREAYYTSVAASKRGRHDQRQRPETY